MERLRCRAKTSYNTKDFRIISNGGFSVTISLVVILLVPLVQAQTTLTLEPSSTVPTMTNSDPVGNQLGETLELLTTPTTSGLEMTTTSGSVVKTNTSGTMVDPQPTSTLVVDPQPTSTLVVDPQPTSTLVVVPTTTGTAPLDPSTSGSEGTSIQPSSEALSTFSSIVESTSTGGIQPSSEAPSTFSSIVESTSTGAIVPTETQSTLASPTVTPTTVITDAPPVYCSSDTCQHGGTCRNDTVLEKFNCTCTSAWTGEVCDENVNECKNDMLHNCSPQANCSDTDGSFTCRCWPGYEGDGVTCEASPVYCSSDTCQHGGTCRNDTVLEKFNCTCTSAWTGDICAENVNECKNDMLHNCSPQANCSDTDGSFTCRCWPGYEGDGVTCEASPVYCSSDTCQHGGTCRNDTVLEKFNCTCTSAWTGDICAENINECKNDMLHNCSPQANCSDTDGSFTCRCWPGYEGDGVTCEASPVYCSSDTCQHGGTCRNDTVLEKFNCTCTSAWTGDICAENVNECKNDMLHNCSPQANCSDTDGSFTCRCWPGYEGDGVTCEASPVYCSSDTCQHGGTCRNDTVLEKFNCTCTSAWTGDICAENVNECKNDMLHNCSPQANCSDTDGSFTCRCWPGYEGDGVTCEDIDECKNPKYETNCHEDANCVNNNGNFVCICKDGYDGSGTDCEDINECLPDPCHNHGYCVNRLNDYTCLCNNGWTGPNCSTEIDICQPDPCKNGGRCNKIRAVFECNCTGTNLDVGSGDFEGKTCEKENTIFGRADLAGVTPMRSDDDVYGPYRFPGGFPYTSALHYSVYVSMNGYVVLTQTFSARARPATTDNKVFLAPFLTDLDARADSSNYPSSLSVKMYQQFVERDHEYLDSLGRIVQIKSSTDNVMITSALVASWFNMAPFPATSYIEAREGVPQLSQRITFQLVLATDGKQTFAIFNYDRWDLEWDFTDASRPVASIGYTAADGTFQELPDKGMSPAELIHSSNVGKGGRWVFKVGNVNKNPRSDCLRWYYNPANNLKEIKQTDDLTLPACPCTASQAQDDARFYFFKSENKAESVMWKANMKARCYYEQASGALQVGYPNGGYVLFYNENDTTSQSAGQELCCERTSMCDRFYTRQMTTNCENYKAPSISLSWGKPHIYTLNGYEYTFNGLGEYVLINSTHFNLQCRTAQIIPDKNATFFTGYAVKDADTEQLQFLYAEGGIIDIYFNGSKIAEANSTAITGDLSEITNPNIRLNNGRLTILFSGEIALQMMAYDPGYLRLAVAASLDIFDSPKGLLFGSVDTDAMLRDGTQLNITADTTEAELFKFAKSWALSSEDESLFTYGAKSFNNYLEEAKTFTPEFYSDLLRADESLVPEDIRTQCGGVRSCLVDYLATGDKDIAETSQSIKTELDNQIRILGNHAPVIDARMPSIINITMGNELILQVLVTDADNDDITVFQTFLQQFTVDVNRTIHWMPNVSVRTFEDGLKVVVSDSQNASDIYWPELHICACADANECAWDSFDDVEMTASSGRVYFARCDCARSKTGRWCEVDVDLCMVSPDTCYQGVNCSVENGEAICGPCPDGMTQLDQKCYHVNHCLRENNCDQKCDYIHNTSTYNCSCHANYELLNSTHCIDVDECREGTVPCDLSEYCHNIPGGADCRCLPGFSRYAGTCRRDADVKQFSGSLTCQRVGNAAWSEELRNEKSGAYEGVVETLKEALTVIFNSTHTNEGLKDVKITNLSNGSIAVGYDLYMKREVTQDNIDSAMNTAFGSCNARCVLANNIVGINADQALAPQAKNFCTAELNPCNTDSTLCNSTDGNWRCNCKPGFNPLPYSKTLCQDIDECSSGECGTAQCQNTMGSFSCFCSDGFVYSEAEKQCMGVCEVVPCKNGGTCTPAGQTGYACQCTSDWKGPTCEEDNSNTAEDWKQKLIIVGSVLGALCLIFMIALLICFCRRRMSEKDGQDNPSYYSSRGSRYQTDMKDEGAAGTWEGKIPRAQLRKLQVYDSVEMEERADDRHYASLHDDSSHYDEPNKSLTYLNEKTLKSGADNPAYDNSPTSKESRNSRF